MSPVASVISRLVVGSGPDMRKPLAQEGSPR
jgi:hypothetical protein